MSIEFNCYRSGTPIPPLELELYINGELVGARTANANDSQGISLTYNNLQSNDVIKVVAKSISSTVSNTYAYISFQTYPRIATIATTGTETDFKNNLKNWCQTIIYNKDRLDNYITLVKIPDVENSPYNYNTILAEALLINYNYFISQDSQNRDIYNFNIKSLPFEYNYSPCYFHIEFTYKDWDYSDPIDITSMYISTMGINPEYAYSRFSMLDTIMEDYYGPTLSWSNYGTYLEYTNSFTSLKITNTMTWSTIKLTIDSQDLVSPLVTTLAQGQSLTLDDVGITYDSIRAEYNTTTTEDLWDIVSALHAKIDYMDSLVTESNLDLTNTKCTNVTINKLSKQNNIVSLDFEGMTNFVNSSDYNLIGTLPSSYLPRYNSYYSDVRLYFDVEVSGMNKIVLGRITDNGEVQIYNDPTGSSTERVGYVPNSQHVRIHTVWFTK